MIANRLHSRPTPCKGGAALTEYALLTALIAVVAMTSIVALSGKVERIFNRAAFEVSLILGKENYLANGGFEALDGATPTSYGFVGGALPGWASIGGHQFELHANGWEGLTSPQGGYWLDLGASPGNLTIAQDIPDLHPQGTYKVSFLAGDRTGDLSNRVEVYFGGVLVGVVDPEIQDAMERYEYIVTAGSGDGSDSLVFLEAGVPDSAGMAIDEVRVFGVPRTQ